MLCKVINVSNVYMIIQQALNTAFNEYSEIQRYKHWDGLENATEQGSICTFVQGASSTPRYALQVGTQRKLSSHLSDCRSTGTDFVPIVAKTLGGLSEDSINMVLSLGKSIVQRANPQDPLACSAQLFQHLAITLWCRNATLWLNRQPHLPPPSVDGII